MLDTGSTGAPTSEDRAGFVARAWRPVPRGPAIGLAVLAAVFLACAIVVRETGGPDVIGLDGEWGFPAFASAAVLVVASLATVRATRAGLLVTWGGWVLSGLFLLMAADELMTFHEELERLTNITWQLLYLPIMIVAGVAWLVVQRDLLRRRPAGWEAGSSLLLLGAVAWAGSQFLEMIQWDGDRQVAHYGLLMVPEEIGEVVGSGLFALAALSLLRAHEARHRA